MKEIGKSVLALRSNAVLGLLIALLLGHLAGNHGLQTIRLMSQIAHKAGLEAAAHGA